MTRVVVKRIDVLTAAKWIALPLTIMGIFAGLIYGLEWIHSVEGETRVGVFYIVSLPIEYGVLGFITGVISATIYNRAVKSGGGIVLEIETDNSELTTV